MKKLFMSSLGTNFLVLCINMATGIMSARYLGPYGRGELAVANRWSGLFIMLFTIGLPGAVIYLGKQYSQKQKEYCGSYIIVGSIVGIIGLISGEISIPQILKGQPTPLIRISQIAMLTVPFGVLADGLVGTLQTVNQFKKVMMTRILSEAGALSAVIGLLIFGVYSARSYVLVNTIWSIAVFGLTLYWVQTVIQPRISIAPKQFKDLLFKGAQIYATSLVNVFGGNLDQLAISVFLTPYTLGLYAVSSSIGFVFPSMIVGALGIYLWPKLMDLSLDDRNKRIGEIHSVLFYGSLLTSIGIMALTRFLVPMMYGRKYVAGIPMAEIMVLGAAVSVGYVVLTNYISTRGKFYYTTVAEALGLVCGLGVTLPLLHLWGGIGAAVGLLTTNVVKWIFAVFVCAHLGINRRALFKPNAKLAKNALSDVLRKRSATRVTDAEPSM